jgi:hypothetical protein
MSLSCVIANGYPILSILGDYSPLKFLNMRKKSGFTIVEQAVVLVPEFEKLSTSWTTGYVARDKAKVR